MYVHGNWNWRRTFKSLRLYMCVLVLKSSINSDTRSRPSHTYIHLANKEISQKKHKLVDLCEINPVQVKRKTFKRPNNDNNKPECFKKYSRTRESCFFPRAALRLLYGRTFNLLRKHTAFSESNGMLEHWTVLLPRGVAVTKLCLLLLVWQIQPSVTDSSFSDAKQSPVAPTEIRLMKKTSATTSAVSLSYVRESTSNP